MTPQQTSLIIGLGIGLILISILSLVGVWLYYKLLPFLQSHNRTPYSSKVQSGRIAATGHVGMVVFLIGMKINKWYRVDLWVPPLLAMSRMLEELHVEDEDLGYYGGETYGILALLFGYPSLQVTYWENMESVAAFASGDSHVKSMGKYVQAMAKSEGAVGVWHELFEVSNVEGMHRDMPPFGLVRAVGGTPATGEKYDAKGRREENLKELPLYHSRPQQSPSNGAPRKCPFSNKTRRERASNNTHSTVVV